LKGKNLKSLKFLSKFVREFPNISDIDIGGNKIDNDEMKAFTSELVHNRHIQNIQTGNIGMSGQTKRLMQKELEKNK
jgi:hypothetical protein